VEVAALTLDSSTSDLLMLAGRSPIVQAAAIVLGTFILEDATSIATAIAVQDHYIPLNRGLASLFLGIVVGDLGLYGLGMLAARLHEGSKWANRLVPPERRVRGREWVDNRLRRLVFTARFLPGMRLPAYTTCGFLGADFGRFATAAIGATLIWTGLLFFLSMRLGALLIAHLGAWRWAGAAVVIVVMVAVTRFIGRAQSTGKAPL
jgi:membrane protein DedA with SNARE-associated domain